MLKTKAYWKDGKEFDEDIHYRFNIEEIEFIETSTSGYFLEVNLKNGKLYWFRSTKAIAFDYGAILIK